MTDTSSTPLDRWPAASIDIVLFTVIGNVLNLALVRRSSGIHVGELSLIGGTIKKDNDQTLDDAAARIMRDRGGLQGIFLEQLYTFGGQRRDPRGWSISVAYYGLVAEGELRCSPVQLDLYPVDRVPALPFDHNQIVEVALNRLRAKGGYTTIPGRLLPEEFSLAQMQMVYETVLGRPMNTSAFRRKILELDIVEKVSRKVSLHGVIAKSTRPSDLYRLKAKDEVLPRLF